MLRMLVRVVVVVVVLMWVVLLVLLGDMGVCGSVLLLWCTRGGVGPEGFAATTSHDDTLMGVDCGEECERAKAEGRESSGREK